MEVVASTALQRIFEEQKIHADDFKLEVASGGLLNSVFIVWIGDAPKFVLRVTSDGEASTSRRKAESIAISHASQYRLCPRTLHFCNNFMLQEFVSGGILGFSTLNNVHVQELVAEKMARFHSIPFFFDESGEPWIRTAMKDCLAQLNNAKLNVEGELLLRLMDESKSPVGLCHNDLSPSNIIYNRDANEVHFIDLEFAAVNYAYYDIAQYIWQHQDAQHPRDFSLMAPDVLVAFVRAYLRELIHDEPSQDEVDAVVNEMWLFGAVANFFWCIFHRANSLPLSRPDFCYAKMANARYVNFKKCLKKIKLPTV